MVQAAALKSCALFTGFTDTGLQILAGIASEKAFPQGTPLFVENMVSDSLLIIAAGTVRLSGKDPAGHDVALGVLGANDFLGELSLVQPGQRMCTAVAATAVTAIEIRHADFQKLMGQKPQACLKLLMAAIGQFGAKVAENKDSFKALLKP